MADEYTPTDEQVRMGFVAALQWAAEVEGGDVDETEALASYDRWLAAHDAQVAEKALRDAAEAANREWLRLKDGPWGSNPTDQAIIEFATRAIAWINARADALTVADAPAADDVWEALFERVAAVADVATRLGAAVDAVVAVLGLTVTDEGRA